MSPEPGTRGPRSARPDPVAGGTPGVPGTEPLKPLPARELPEARPEGATQPPALPAERARLLVDGSVWTVEVVGRAHGSGSGGVPGLLRLRVRRDGDEGPGLGSWVVGVRLEDVPESGLERVVREAVPWREPRTGAGFFEDVGDRGR